MYEHVFPKPVQNVVATLADIYRHKGQAEIVELLESADARIEQIEYDNWNGGTYTYALELDIPVPIFARIESKLEKIEKAISSTLGIICRNLANDHLGSVTITPLSVSPGAFGQSVTPPADVEVKHIWHRGTFRLFLSHVSAHKLAVSSLQSELALRGISAFVAHEDIIPSFEWQKEIELALRSMHALAALLTPDFHPSNWTDQEVGFALGRGIPVVPVRLGADPYGFIGKYQGISGTLPKPRHLADLLVRALLRQHSTKRGVRAAIVAAWASVSVPDSAEILCDLVTGIDDFSDDEKTKIQQACTENNLLSENDLLTERALTAIGRRGLTPLYESDIPF